MCVLFTSLIPIFLFFFLFCLIISDVSPMISVKFLKQLLQWAASITFKLLALVFLLFRVRGTIIHKAELKCLNDKPPEEPTTAAIAGDGNYVCQDDEGEASFNPCLERLQRLEELIAELDKKPKKIPPEKDIMISESLNRIKTLEHDLQKTRYVSTFEWVF